MSSAAEDVKPLVDQRKRAAPDVEVIEHPESTSKRAKASGAASTAATTSSARSQGSNVSRVPAPPPAPKDELGFARVEMCLVDAEELVRDMDLAWQVVINIGRPFECGTPKTYTCTTDEKQHLNYKWELRDYDTPLLVDGFGRAQEAQFKAKVAQVKELARNLKPSESIKFTITRIPNGKYHYIMDFS